MQINHFPFQIVDWDTIEKINHAGTTGVSIWKTYMMNNIRVRMVEYSENYLADHWCHKGHIIFCVEGEMETELKDGRKLLLSKGMTYHVGDDSEAHRSSTRNGCKLFIVD